ncbi:MAG TPA: hypothetical protein VFU71_10160 [Burkholderiaceae bacterium]|nr:hypothetical protein [Burkholderiaceae bacterium]
MEEAKLASPSSRAELAVVAGTIVTMVLSSVCVVVVCAAANGVAEPAAKIIYAAPAASAPGDLAAPTNVAGAGAAVMSLR